MKIRFSVHPLAAAGIFVVCALMPPERSFGALAAVLVHEAAHLFAGRSAGLSLRGVKLMPFGISFEMSAPRSYVEQIFVCAAGPVMNFTVCALISSGVFPKSAACAELFAFSMAMAAVNTIPIRQLDGGEILFATCSLLFGNAVSERILDITSAVFTSLVWLTGVYIFFYDSENMALLAFSAFLFVAGFINSDKKRNIT